MKPIQIEDLNINGFKNEIEIQNIIEADACKRAKKMKIYFSRSMNW
jgi:hypothetical protein